MASAQSAGRVLVYGAYGYSARLVCLHFVKRQVPFAIAGRSADKLSLFADELNALQPGPVAPIEAITATLDSLSSALSQRPDIKVLLNGAGPFVWTFKDTVKACMANKVHYLDITGEIQVFEHAQHLAAKAREAGIAVVPGVGFDVVPTDCLANKLKEALPTATHLELAWGGFGGGGTSHGTATTMAINLGATTVGRVNGAIAPIGYVSKDVALRHGSKRTNQCSAISWGDISTAFHSTGIPNITVFTRTDGNAGWALWFASLSLVKKFLGTDMAKNFVRGRIKEGGPSDEQRIKGISALYGRAWDSREGHETDQVEMWLETRSGYELTYLTAAECAERLLYKRGLAVEDPKGAFTPAQLFGSGLLDESPECNTKWHVEDHRVGAAAKDDGAAAAAGAGAASSRL